MWKLENIYKVDRFIYTSTQRDAWPYVIVQIIKKKNLPLFIKRGPPLIESTASCRHFQAILKFNIMVQEIAQIFKLNCMEFT